MTPPPHKFLLGSFPPQPPPKMGGPSGGNLEELLVTLEQDLANRGVPTQDKGVCGGCRRPIVGKALVALGRLWHPEHLVCGHCGGALGGSPFLERGGVPYCPPDYGRLFAPKCAQCHQPVLQEVVTALGHTWHPQHFCCAHCGKPLGDQGFVEQDGRPFCPRDFSLLFSPRCPGCSGPVVTEFVAAMGGLWHPRCFVCQASPALRVCDRARGRTRRPDRPGAQQEALKRNPATREDGRWRTGRFPLPKMGSVPRPSES
ncbi:transforming growth factor beta-1-induced transcript 1 protein [Columba livia]|uniref:transforming growth factor beta-1-induced transcript 1 protein n=1 Tax=Columba livia TaxID=8932 RepID=UPI0031BB7261